MLYETPSPRLYGGLFEYVNVNSARLVVTDPAGFFRIRMGNGTSFRYVASSATKTLDLAVEGAGGIHDTYHPEQVSTVYTIYAAWRSSTAVDDGDLVLFAVPSGTVVNGGLVAALTGGAGVYDYWSFPIGFVVNSAAGDVVSFTHDLGGGKWYLSPQAALTAGKATATTAIPLGALVPAEAVDVAVFYSLENGDATERKGEIHIRTHSQTWYYMNAAAGRWYHYTDKITVPIKTYNVNTVLAYKWATAPTTGTSVWVYDVTMEP